MKSRYQEIGGLDPGAGGEAAQEEIRTLETLNAELKELQEARTQIAITDQAALDANTLKIQALQTEINKVNELKTSEQQLREERQKSADFAFQQAQIEKDLEAESDAIFDKYLEQSEQQITTDAEVTAATKATSEQREAQIQQEYLTKKQISDLEQELQFAKANLAANIAGLLASIAGRETQAGKAFAIAEATISTFTSAQKAYQSLVGIPIVGPALGAVAAATAVVSGLARIRAIANVKIPSFFGGTEYLERGDNPKGKDTIPLFANEGERIVPTAINEQLAGVSNPELPRLVKLGKQAESGAFNKMVSEQMKTNALLKGFKYIDKDGNLHDLEGNVVKYVA